MSPNQAVNVLMNWNEILHLRNVNLRQVASISIMMLKAINMTKTNN